jgi:hypothetical protein
VCPQNFPNKFPNILFIYFDVLDMISRASVLVFSNFLKVILRSYDRKFQWNNLSAKKLGNCDIENLQVWIRIRNRKGQK